MDVRQTVLLVEDDLDLSKLVSGLIAEAGYQPITIADHAQISSAVERWQPRCVILDGEVRSTGEGRSWDDAVALRRTHPTLPVLMFTADTAALAEAESGTSARSRAAGFTGSVSKPFLVEEFLATLRAAMPESARPDSPSGSRSDPGRAEAISVFPDLTGRYATEAERGDLVASAAHELRAPLTVMRGQMQLARRRLAHDPVRSGMALDVAIAQVDRMARTIDEVIEHSRLAANALALNVVPFDLLDLVAQAIERHQHSDSMRIRLERTDATSAPCRGDPGRIAEILDNLIDNALKYSAADAPVELTVTAANGEAQVRVQDHGVGVPDDEVVGLFAPYYRTTRTRHVAGTGLGLHISRQLAERNRGRLWLESSSSAGSSFVLALPLAR
ncbi:MAG TPA: ATP-binding protein [Candidatus Limnocylindria bacterium]|nr:ATP-binding protein [Candidatus Limnocylindria bacterium]